MPHRTALLICFLVLCAAHPAGAQTAPGALRARMDQFMAALREQAPMERIAGFFPRSTTWEFVETPVEAGEYAVVRRRTFQPRETLTAIREGGEVCHAFGGVRGEFGPMEDAIVSRARHDARPWRFTPDGRFVPPGLDARSPTFVQWIL